MEELEVEEGGGMSGDKEVKIEVCGGELYEVEER